MASARSSSWRSSPSSSGVRSTAVVSRQCARSASPSNTPTVVSVLPMSNTRITNPPRERESHCAPRHRRRSCGRAAHRARRSPAPRPRQVRWRDARAPSLCARTSRSSCVESEPRAAAAARTAGTRAASTSMRSESGRSARASGTPPGTRQLIPMPIATQSTRSSRQRLSMRMPPSFPFASTRSFGHLTPNIAVRERVECARGRKADAERQHLERMRHRVGRAMIVDQIPAPGSDAHARPPRPRPAVCRSARINVPSASRRARADARRRASRSPRRAARPVGRRNVRRSSPRRRLRSPRRRAPQPCARA